MVKRLLLTLLLLPGLAGVYGYLVIVRENGHRDLIRQGDAAMAAGDFSTAIEAFSGAIALKHDSMVGYLMRGDAYRRRDELEAALRDLRQAAEIDPGAPRPRELLGDVNYARHRYPPAAEHYQAYVDLDDRSPRVLYKLALARYRAGQPTLGIEALQKAVAIDDNFAEAYYLMGLCQRDAQRPSEAIVSLQKAISIAPAGALPAGAGGARRPLRAPRTHGGVDHPARGVEGARPGPGARRHAGARLLEGRTVRPRGDHACGTPPSAIRRTGTRTSRSAGSGWSRRRRGRIASS